MSVGWLRLVETTGALSADAGTTYRLPVVSSAAGLRDRSEHTAEVVVRLQLGVARRQVLDARYEQEQATARHKRARARWKQTQELQSAGAARDQAGVDVSTPLAGTIVETHIVPGAYVESGSKMLHVVDLDRLWLEVHVTEIHAGGADRVALNAAGHAPPQGVARHVVNSSIPS